MPTEFLIDPTTIELAQVIADRDAIRVRNPQRFDMEQLDAIVLLDPERKLIAGYKDVRGDEFWVSGHMPGNPLLPGVVMCEAAAQLCSFYLHSQGVIGAGQFMGFGGMDGVRFRRTVRPGERLVLVAYADKIKRSVCVLKTQGFVDNALAFEGEIICLPLTLGAS